MVLTSLKKIFGTKQQLFFQQFEIILQLYKCLPNLTVYKCKTIATNEQVFVSQMKNATQMVQVCISKKLNFLPVECILDDEFVIHKSGAQLVLHKCEQEQHVVLLKDRLHLHAMQICTLVKQYHDNQVTHNAIAWDNVFVLENCLYLGLPSCIKGKQRTDLSQLRFLCNHNARLQVLHNGLENDIHLDMLKSARGVFCKVLLLGTGASGKSTLFRTLFRPTDCTCKCYL